MFEQAGRLQFEYLVEAVRVELHRQAARQHRRNASQIFGVAVLLRADRAHEAVEPRAIERRLVQILGGPDELSRLTPHRIADRSGRTAAFGYEEEHQLSGTLGHGQVELAILLLLLPRLGRGNPVLGRGIGRPLKEGGHEQESGPLVGREVGRHPDPVTLLQAGYLRDRQGYCAARDADPQRRPRQIEGRRFRWLRHARR